MNIFSFLDRYVNYKTIGIISSFLCMLFTGYMNTRQYFFVIHHEQQWLESYPNFSDVCSFDMTLKNVQNYPKCPKAVAARIFKYHYWKAMHFCGALHRLFSDLTFIIVFGTSLYPKLASYFSESPSDDISGFFAFAYCLELPASILMWPGLVYTVVFIEPFYNSAAKQNSTFLLVLIYLGMIIYPFISPVFSVVVQLIYEAVLQTVLMEYSFAGCLFLTGFYLYILSFLSSPRVLKFFLRYKSLPETKFLNDFGPMVDKMKFPKTNVLLIAKSNVPPRYDVNAMVFGGFGNYSMLVFDGLVKLMTVPELKGIVCHELGHWYHSHLNSRIIVVWFKVAIFLYLYTGFMENRATHNADFGTSLKTHVTNEFIFVFGIFNVAFKVFESIFFQSQELESDAMSVHFGLGKELKDALTKLYTATPAPPMEPFVSKCLSTHPTLEERHHIIDNTIVNTQRKLRRRSRRLS